MERNLSADNSSDVEEIPDVRTLSLAQLETILAQQEVESRTALDKAFAGIRQAARYREAANKCEDNSRAARLRYEDAEIVIREVRKIIVERNKQSIDGQVEPCQVRSSEKRKHSPSSRSNVSRKRVAPTATQASETVIKVEDPTDASQLHMNDVPTIGAHVTSLDEAFLRENTRDDQPLDNTYNNEPSNEYRNNNEQSYNTKFIPQHRAKAMTLHSRSSPREIFAHSAAYHPKRMIRLGNPEKEILIYASGQFLGRNKRKGIPGHAGCALILGSETRKGHKHIGFPLERRGPQGVAYHDMGQKTAELRALVAALEYKIWSTEGWEKVVIATTCVYVFRGITEYVAVWAARGWLEGAYHEGQQLPNFDLWARALALVNEQAYRGCEVEIWKLTPPEAKEVSAAARVVANQARAPEVYQSLGDVDITWTAESAYDFSAGVDMTLAARTDCREERAKRRAEKRRKRREQKPAAQSRRLLRYIYALGAILDVKNACFLVNEFCL